MRKAIVLASLGMANTWSLLAQTSFTRVYEGGIGYQFNLNELSSHNILAAMGGIALLDTSGNVLHASYYPVGGVLAMQSVRTVSANEFYFVAGFHDGSCPSNGMSGALIHPLIGKMDSLGNVYSLRYYPLNTDMCWNLPSDLEVTSDHGVVAWGRPGQQNERSFFALRADSSGEVVWSKTFGRGGYFQFIRELPNGDLLAGFNMDTAGASIARLDPTGNFIWCKSYFRPGGRVHDVILEADGSCIVTGYTSTSEPKLFMLKLDGEGSVQWCRGYDIAPDQWYADQWSRIRRTLDSNYIVLGTLGQAGLFYRPLLMKTTPNGDTLWAHSTGVNGYTYYTRDLLATSDGSFVFSGGIWGVLPGGNTGLPYIARTDSLGHFPCFEQVHTLQMLDLFPTDSSFTIIGLDGATANSTSVSSIAIDPITVYDGCTFSTGMVPSFRLNQRLSIHPNPNTGHFTLTFKDPLQAESYYSVYDAAGKLLYQRPLPAGKGTEEVDLSRYGKGTYVIKCTDKEGVYHERVVVE